MKDKKGFECVGNDELKKQVEERKNWLIKVYKFVEFIMEKCGVVTYKHEGRFHTHIVKAVNGFNGFSIIHASGHSEMGGNEIEIKYGTKLILNLDGDIKGLHADRFKVIFLTDDKAKIDLLDQTIRNKKRIVERYLKKTAEKKEKVVKASNDSAERKELLSEAERLGL